MVLVEVYRKEVNHGMKFKKLVRKGSFFGYRGLNIRTPKTRKFTENSYEIGAVHKKNPILCFVHPKLITIRIETLV